MKNAVVLGAGSFGSAIAVLLADRGLKVHLWGRDATVVDEVNLKHTNQKFLPNIELPASIQASTSLDSCREADLVVFVVPSSYFRQVGLQLQKVGVPKQCVMLSCTKGIEKETGSRMSQVLEQCFPGNAAAVLSGPTHAEEVARRMPSAAVVACKNSEVAVVLQEVFSLPYFRTYTTSDIIGVEIGSTVKNIAAIACGIVEGLGLGDNAKAGLVTRGLAEMIRLGVAMGGNPQTFMGLSGVGDLMVTCFSEHSRNFKVGRMLGEGLQLSEVQERLQMVAEGVPNTESVYQFAKSKDVRTPITELLYAVLNERMTVAEAGQLLLSRSPRPEAE